MAKKSKAEKSWTSSFIPLISKFLEIADRAIKEDKEIKYIGRLKLPFGMKTANAMYSISFKPIKKKK